MKNNILSLVVLTIMTFGISLQAANTAPAVHANEAAPHVVTKPKVFKKRSKPSKFSLFVKFCKNKFNRKMRKAKANWTRFSKNNPKSATALKYGTYTAGSLVALYALFRLHKALRGDKSE